MSHKRVSFVLVCTTIVCASVVTAMAAVWNEQPRLDGQAIARAYIAGMESGDLEAINALFLPDDRSSILENASEEGSWEHYRDHHLKPEMEAAKNFEFTIAKETVEQFGEVTIVQQTGSFTVEVRNEVRKYRVAVSYVIVTEEDQLRIAHLHWSSRADKRAQTQP